MTRAALLEALRDELGDGAVLRAMGAVDRAAFVPAAEAGAAWEDRALPLAEGQTVSQPSLVARMCALLDLRGDEVVLDVGTGSGYHAAVLARLARHVVSVERHATLSARAGEALREAGVANVTLVVGDGALGWPDLAPYDAINVAASAGAVPTPLVEQLAAGGRMVLPVGERLVLLQALEAVRFVPLVEG